MKYIESPYRGAPSLSATTVITADKGKPDYVWIAMIPLMLFFFLDAYYLGLEHRFRTLYNDFMDKLHASTATISDVYTLRLSGSMKTALLSTARAFTSLSMWPFYGLLTSMLIIVRLWVLPRPS
jgi:hypothetical protein